MEALAPSFFHHQTKIALFGGQWEFAEFPGFIGVREKSKREKFSRQERITVAQNANFPSNPGNPRNYSPIPGKVRRLEGSPLLFSLPFSRLE